MRYCSKCGEQIEDNAKFCPNCGSAQEGVVEVPQNQQQAKTADMKTIAKVFMVLGCILSAFYFLIPLCWTVPMTVCYFQNVKQHRPVSVTFKVCTLLFVSLIAGILMLCDKED